MWISTSMNARCSSTRKSAHSQTGQGQTAAAPRTKIPFSFGLDTEKGFPHEGHLVFADNQYTEGTGTILVRGVAENPDGKLIPGSRVRVRVPVSDKYEATWSPTRPCSPTRTRNTCSSLGRGQYGQASEHYSWPAARRRDAGHPTEPGDENAAGQQRLESRNGASEWIITSGLQRARINYPVQPLDSDGQPFDTWLPGSKAIQVQSSETRSCSLVSSSIGRSLPPCSRW